MRSKDEIQILNDAINDILENTDIYASLNPSNV